MKLHTHEEMLTNVFGKRGTPKREAHEADIEMFIAGEAIKAAREAKSLTQEQLGQRLGVGRAQISRMESGRNLTLATISRVFRALGVTAVLDIAGIGKVTLA